MATVIFCYGVKITRDEKVIKYIDSQFAISSTEKNNPNTIKRTCYLSLWVSRQVVDYDLLWKVGNNFYPITD